MSSLLVVLTLFPLSPFRDVQGMNHPPASEMDNLMVDRSSSGKGGSEEHVDIQVVES
jgi:hypothetical protein